jgi:hypothetical protein
MLSGILRHATASDPAVRIVAEVGTLEMLSAAVANTRPHVMVVGVGEGEAELPKECARLMYAIPHPRTLTISSDGQVTSAWRLRPQGKRMENISPAEMLEVLRELSDPPPELRD